MKVLYLPYRDTNDYIGGLTKKSTLYLTCLIYPYNTHCTFKFINGFVWNTVGGQLSPLHAYWGSLMLSRRPMTSHKLMQTHMIYVYRLAVVYFTCM